MDNKRSRRVKMRFKFSLALLLSAIVLASCASADLVSTTLVGGVTSSAQNGGTTGIVNHANYYTANDVNAPLIDGIAYDNVLEEYVALAASVAERKTGSASASFDTKTPQSFSFNDYAAHTALSTSLNGALSVSVTKDTLDGSAEATALMRAQSGATGTKVGSSADLVAYEHLSGVGTALADISKATATAGALYTAPYPDDYAQSSVSGDIKLTAKNTNDDLTLATNGGEITGNAGIHSIANENDAGVGTGRTEEFMSLNAHRGQSFSGLSYADGYLNGQEMAESTWYNSANGKATVDIESTSKITQSVAARNIRDIANTNSWLYLEAGTRNDGSAYAYNDWFAGANVTRDTNGGALKAEANAYMPIATWVASGSVQNTGVLAAISGQQGKAWDGIPAQNPGFGVGAWILNTYNQQQVATMHVFDWADTQPAAGTTGSIFDLYLNGMKTITGTQNDAVGAFGAVANQHVVIKRAVPFTSGVTSSAPEITDVNAINWLVGDDPNPLPGAGKYSPSSMMISFAPTDALQRTTELSYTQSNPA
jgi:hypothetical protein